MPAKTDYSQNSRFRTDNGFKVLTRKRQVTPSISIMPVPIRSPRDRTMVVPLRFERRWDLLANEVLGDVRLKWVIMRHNRISDPFRTPRAGQQLLVPTPSQVRYYLQQS